MTCGRACVDDMPLCHSHVVEREKALGFLCVHADRSDDLHGVAGFKALGEYAHFDVHNYREFDEVPGMRTGIVCVFVYLPAWAAVLWNTYRGIALLRPGTPAALVYNLLAAFQPHEAQASLVSVHSVGGDGAVIHLLRSRGLLPEASSR